MSFFDVEKLNAAQKANIDLLQQVAGKLFESAEQLGQLQFKTLRASADAQIENLRKLSETRDPQAFLDWQGAFAQKAAQAEQVLEFNRKVYELISSTQSEISKLAERQVAAGSQQVQELVETIAKNAPAGAEPAVAVLRSALAKAHRKPPNKLLKSLKTALLRPPPQPIKRPAKPAKPPVAKKPPKRLLS